MKRYLVFSTYDYYPTGGWYDFIGDYDDFEEAKTVANEKMLDSSHVVDSETQEVIYSVSWSLKKNL